MPRPRRARPPSPPRQAPRRQSRQRLPEALTAAGARITTRPGSKPKQGTVAQAWQDEAWYFYDTVPELAQSCQWVANSLSRVDLDVMEVKADGSVEPTTNPEPLAALDALYDGDTGQSDMLATMGIHLSCPGETYLVGVPPRDPFSVAPDVWRVLSNQEIRQQAGQWIIDRGDGVEEKYADGTKPDVPAEAIVIRIWRSHPAMWVQANSPVRAALTVLRTLEKVSQHIAASADSRLAGAGVFIIPKGATWETPTDPEGANVEDDTVQDTAMGTLTMAMLTPMADRGNAAARVPIVMTLPDDLADKVQHIKFDLPFDEQVIPLSDNQIRRLAVGMDMPVEALLGVGDVNHWCMDQETEVFTRRGWVGVDSFETGEEVLALDHETGASTWAVAGEVYRADVIDEPMLAMETRTHSSVTTLHHRWPVVTPEGVRRWRQSSELGAYDAITTGAPHSGLPDLPKYDDSLVELVAWLWTEGNVQTSGRVSIAQSHTANPGRVDRIRLALTRAFGMDGFTERVQRNVSSFGGPITVFYPRRAEGEALLCLAPGKRPTNEFIDSLTLAQLHLFIDTSCEGDGTHWRTGARDIWQRDPEAADAYERACILAGYAVSKQPGHSGGTVVTALRTTQVVPMKAIKQVRRGGGGTATGETVAYTGRIWCPSVPRFHSFLARRSGRTFYTGNTGWLISEEGIKVHIEPLVNVICTALTQRYLWPILAGTDLDPLDGSIPAEVKRYVIRGDTSALRQRPDMTEQAMALHARMVLTDAALAREVGFSSGDLLVPGSEEFRRRLLMNVAGGITTGDQTQAALDALGAGITPQSAEVAPAAGTPAALPAGPTTEPATLPTRGTPDRAESPLAASALDPDALRASAQAMRDTVAAALAARQPQVAQYGAVLAVADLAVSRALERAHSRLFGRSKGRPRPVTGDRVTEALRDAWTLLPDAAANLGVDPDLLRAGCDRYTQELLARGMEHNRDLLGAVVKRMLTVDQVA